MDKKKQAVVTLHVSQMLLGQNKMKNEPFSLPLTANGSAASSPVLRENSFGTGGRHLNRSQWKSGSASSVLGGQGSKPILITNGRDPRRALKR